MADTDPIQSRFDAWHSAPTADNAASVLDALGPDLDHAIQLNGGQPSPITRGMAKNVALDAMHSFDPKGGTKFRTWTQTQMQRLSRPIRASKFVTRVPELRAREAHRVRGAINDLEAKTGFEPSDSQLAEHLGMSMKRIAALRRSSAAEVISQDYDTGDEEPQESTNEALVQDMVYHSLPPRDQLIMEHMLGHNGNKVSSGQDVAKRLKISPAAVSQHLAKIRGMLQQAQGLV